MQGCGPQPPSPQPFRGAAATRHRGAERVEPTLDDLGCRLHGISAQRGRECIHARLRSREAVDRERGAAGDAIERLTAQQRSSWAPIAAPQLTQSMLPFGCSSRARVDARHRPHQPFLLQELRKRLVHTVPRETPELQRLTPARAVVHRLQRAPAPRATGIVAQHLVRRGRRSANFAAKALRQAVQLARPYAPERQLATSPAASACLSAWYDERTIAPTAACVKPISTASRSNILNVSGCT